MLKVKKVMIANVVTLKKEAKIEEAAKLLSNEQNGCVIVVEGNKPIGIITQLDIIRNIVSNRLNFKEPVMRIMSSPLTVMEPSMKLDEALKIIDTKNFRMYPIVEDGALVGLITKNDVVHAISDNLKFHRNLQNVVLVIFVLFEFFVFVFSEYLNKLTPWILK